MPDQPVQLKESEILQIIDRNRALDATYKLLENILEATEFDEMAQKIVDTIPKAMGYELAVMALADLRNKKLCLTAISNINPNKTEADLITSTLKDWCISFGYSDNVALKALSERKQYIVDDIYQVFKPFVTKEQATKIQDTLGTGSHVVTPMEAKDQVIGILIVSVSKPSNKITDFEKEMLTKYSENAGIALDNSRLYSNLIEAQEDLFKAYENLKVLNKMKDEFLTVASHELRTPMTIVKSYLWMLDKNKAGKLNKKQNGYLQKALSGTQRMIALINDMLDISKFEQHKVKFKLTQVDLPEVIREVIITFEIKLKEKRIRLDFSDSYKDYLVDADEQKLKEILTNLIDNAIKFTDKGGIVIGIEGLKDEIKVWLTDTGSGVDKNDLVRLFHKFGRIDNSYTIASETGGTGLGLYIVKLYVEGMGGKVGALSDGIGKGSTFWFTLPRNKIQKYKTTLKQIEIPIQKITSIQQANETPNN